MTNFFGKYPLLTMGIFFVTIPALVFIFGVDKDNVTLEDVLFGVKAFLFLALVVLWGTAWTLNKKP